MTFQFRISNGRMLPVIFVPALSATGCWRLVGATLLVVFFVLLPAASGDFSLFGLMCIGAVLAFPACTLYLTVPRLLEAVGRAVDRLLLRRGRRTTQAPGAGVSPEQAEMIKGKRLRWGALHFGADQSGDMMHFDIGPLADKLQSTTEPNPNGIFFAP